MLRLNPICLLLTIAFAISIANEALCEGLVISVNVNPQTCRIGEEVVFSITFKNAAKQPIGITPDYRAYEALDVKLVQVVTGQKARVVRYVAVGFEEELAQRDFVLLKPGQTHTVRHVAKAMLSLPKRPERWIDSGSGPFLVFADSALDFPLLGTYNVTTRYVAREETRSRLQQSQQKFWWIGETHSSPVKLSITR